MSVQITEVDPRVSTAESRLTSAPRRAIARTPAASASVIVGSNPSGTLATSSPTANTKASVKLSPASTPSGRNATPTATATAAINSATRRIWRSSGESSGLRWPAKRRDAADFGMGAGRVHDGFGGADRAAGAAEHEHRGVEPAFGVVDGVGGPEHRYGFSGEGGGVDLDGAAEQAARRPGRGRPRRARSRPRARARRRARCAARRRAVRWPAAGGSGPAPRRPCSPGSPGRTRTPR